MTKQFRELRSMVGSSMGKKLPGRKELRDSGAKIVASGEGIEVYENGFIFYKEGCRETVYAVDRIDHITYYFADGYKTIGKEELDEMPWDVPIIVVCGMRIDANKFSERFSKEISWEDVGEPVVPSYEEKRLEEMDHTDKLATMYHFLSECTERQQQIVRMYLLGKKKKDIAAELGVAPSTINITIDRVVKEIQKKIKNF